jgi:tetratricopeptide (TPR) repeat protein
VNKKESSVLLFLGLWVAFLFCALISVETSSIASWGFLFAGCLISISQDIKLFGPSSYSSSGIKQPLRDTKIQQSRLYLTLFSSFLISFLVLTPAIKAINLLSNVFINSSLNNPKLDTDTSDVLFLGKGDRNQLLIIANTIYQSGDIKRAKEVLEDFRSKFPAEYRFVDYLAQIAEAEGELNLALEYRLQIAKLNPKFVRNLENLRKLAEQLDEREAFDLANKLYQSIFP